MKNMSMLAASWILSGAAFIAATNTVLAERADAVYRDGVFGTYINHAALLYRYDNANSMRYVIHSAGTDYNPHSVRVGDWNEFIAGNTFTAQKCPANLSKSVRDSIMSDALDQLNAAYWTWNHYEDPNTSPGSGDGHFRCDFLVEWCYEQNGYDVCNDALLYPASPAYQRDRMADAVQTAPSSVTMTYPSSQNPNSPTISGSSTITLQATGSDTHSGLAYNEPFTYWYAKYINGSWTSWTKLDTGGSSLSVDILSPNTVYSWCVDAYDNGGNYTESSVYYFMYVPPPSKATSPSPSSGASGQSVNTDVSWANGGGATSYDVYFGTDSTPDAGELRGNQSSTSYDPGTLAYNTTYYWRIDAKNASGTTQGDTWSFTTALPPPPSKATSPSPSSGASSQSINTDVSWADGGGATSYDVYFGTDSTPDSGELQGNQSGTSYDPGTLTYNTTYYWRIDAKNAGGTTQGDTWSFTTALPPPPSKATSPSPSSGASGQSISTDVSWADGGGATSYDVYFGTANPPQSRGNQSSTSYDPGTLAYNTTYYWRIDAKNAGGTTQGDSWSFTTQVAPPSKATTPNPVNGATAVSKNVDLSWANGGGATSYDVYFGTANPPPSRGNQSGTTYDPGTLAYNITYYWRIDAKNAGGTTQGDTWSFTTERQYSLAVTSPYGQANPPVGTTLFDYGSSVTASITNSPVTATTTQYVCRGWAGTGSVPAAGTTTNTGAFTLTNDSTIAWLWRTNFWLDLAYTVGGTLSTGDCWLANGTNLQVTATPSNHWHFTQWSGQTNGCTIVSNKITVAMDGPRTIMANFAIDQHKLAVSTPYGQAAPPAGTNWLDYGTSTNAAVTNSPVANGATQYVCRGWTGTGSVPASGTTTNTGTFVFTNDSAIAWLWRTNYWLDAGTAGNGVVNVADGWFAAGSNVLVTASPAAHYHFTGWTGQTNGCTFSSNTITAPMTMPRAITASFAIDQHRLTVQSAYGGAIPSVGTNWFDYNTSLTATVTDSPSVNGTTQYVCFAWTGSGSVPANGNTTNTGPFALTNDSVVTWLWKTNYWLDTATNGNGTVNLADGWWPKGSNAQVTATAAAHYHFTGWTGQTNGCTISSNVITAPMTTPRAITANFAIDQHSLIVTTPYGKAFPAAGTNWYNWNSPLTAALTNSPVVNGTTQYVCTGWTGTGSVPPSGTDTNTGPFTLTNNSSIAWLWITNYWLDTATNGNGSVDVTDQWCRVGSNILITATPASFNRFTGWTGQTNGCTIAGNQITALMDRPRAMTANFVRQYSLSVATTYGEGTPPAGTNWYDTGTSITAKLTNSPVVNGGTQYVCRGWAGTGSVPASGATTNAGPFSITNNSTITWLWRTNFWLDVAYTGGGTLSTGDCWLASGTNLQVTATPSNHWHFTQWSGQTNGCTIASNKITVAMDGPRAVAASFVIDQHKLTVTTPYGQANPSAGTNWFNYGSSNSVAMTNSPVIVGGTQYVCRGWTGTGSVPASGATTNTPLFALTNDSSIVWNWRTNYWLHVDKTGSGTVSTNDTWLALGTNVQVTATAATYYVFGCWQGQTNGCTIASNKITVVMNSARTVVAVFNAQLATNNVPKWWLSQYGLTNFNVDATRDVDHDGMLTWQEWVAGCDPTNGNSVFRFTDADGAPGQGMVVRWPSISNRYYNLSRATNLLAGTNAFIILPGASNMPATPTENSYTDAVQGVGPYFYKVDVRE